MVLNGLTSGTLGTGLKVLTDAIKQGFDILDDVGDAIGDAFEDMLWYGKNQILILPITCSVIAWI